MSSRSAEASIKGYSYQFLHTILDILSQADTTVNTVEGIEDLDIYSGDANELYQYKYHEFKQYTNSLVGKPIGLMFNHFIDNKEKNYNYKLIIYIKEKTPIINEERLLKILKLKAAQDYIDDEKIIYCKDEPMIKSFLKKFKCVLADEFSKLEKKTIVKLIEVFNVSEEEARLNLLPNALSVIIKIGIKLNVRERKITTKDFKNTLKSKKDIADIAYLNRVHGEDKTIKILKKRMKSVGIKANNSDHIIYMSNPNNYQLAQLIIDIVKKFFYKGNKKDYRPVIFIIDNMDNLKASLLIAIKKTNDVILFNDGYEDYGFYHKIFNQASMTSAIPNRGKVNDVNFNFKMISLETYQEKKQDIKFFNATLFCVDIPSEDFITEFDRIYYVNGLSNESIISVIGG